MGYTTDFEGQFDLTPPLNLNQVEELTAFAERRHNEQQYPSFYCQWVPTADGAKLEWDGGEKFYDYVGWLKRLINSFFIPWGVTVSGKVRWMGEERSDLGTIIVANNVVTEKRGYINFGED